VTTAAIVLAALLAVAAVLWVARPFLRRAEAVEERPVADEAALARLRLLEDRDRALAGLKELEFDHRTGKISDADYRELVGPLRREAAEAIAALDAAAGKAPETTGPEPDGAAAAGRAREEQPR
jgi:hypothetical protein